MKNVEKETIRELAAELQILSKQARERTIKLEDLRGSTFTVTNYGTYGSTFATPIINYPDVAILRTRENHRQTLGQGRPDQGS